MLSIYAEWIFPLLHFWYVVAVVVVVTVIVVVIIVIFHEIVLVSVREPVYSLQLFRHFTFDSLTSFTRSFLASLCCSVADVFPFIQPNYISNCMHISYIYINPRAGCTQC